MTPSYERRISTNRFYVIITLSAKDCSRINVNLRNTRNGYNSRDGETPEIFDNEKLSRDYRDKVVSDFFGSERFIFLAKRFARNRFNRGRGGGRRTGKRPRE